MLLTGMCTITATVSAFDDQKEIIRTKLNNISYSALEIVTKLCDLEFARKAKAADFLEKAWEGLREAGAGDGDKVQIHSVSFPERYSPCDIGFRYHSSILRLSSI